MSSILRFSAVFVMLCLGKSSFCSDYCSVEDKLCQKWPSVVVPTMQGQLGNCIYSYMMGLAMEQRYGVIVPMMKRVKDSLKRFFKGIEDKPSAEEDFCGFNEFYSQFRDELDRKVVQYYEDKSGRKVKLTRIGIAATLEPIEVAHQFGSLKHIDIIRKPSFSKELKLDYSKFPPDCRLKWEYVQDVMNLLDKDEWKFNRAVFTSSVAQDNARLLKSVDNLADLLLNELVIKTEFLNAAQKKLHEILNIHNANHKVKESKTLDYIFVGIHIRRGDHIKFEQDTGLTPLKSYYFIDAMDLFRNKFKKHRKKRRIIFVLVGDDLKWAKDRIGTKNKDKDLYFASEGDINSDESIGKDFALLASCNHTIQSHGSFSYFAGVFSGGISVTPDHFEEFRKPSMRPFKDLKKNPLENPLPRIPVFVT